MAKLFIFDMDGVIIDTENVWSDQSKSFFDMLYGQELYDAIKDELKGTRLNDEYLIAKYHGFKRSKEEFMTLYHEQAKIVFGLAKLTKGIAEFIELLDECGFMIAIVSSSPSSWIEMALAKIPNSSKFTNILSLNERDDLKGKPAPDGYLEMMKQLSSKPSETIILEDSNRGLEAARNSGAFTICLQEHLSEKNISGAANLYVSNLVDLSMLIKSIR